MKYRDPAKLFRRVAQPFRQRTRETKAILYLQPSFFRLIAKIVCVRKITNHPHVASERTLNIVSYFFFPISATV